MEYRTYKPFKKRTWTLSGLLILLFVGAMLLLSACAGGRNEASDDADGSDDRQRTLQNKGSDTLVNVALAWAEAYRDAGHRVEIVSIRSATIPGIPIHTVALGPVNSTSRVWSFLSYLRLAAQARRYVGRCAPDIVHAHYATTSGVFARLAGHRPVVVTAWGSDVVPARGAAQMPLVRAMNRWALNGADRVTATSRFLADWVRRLAPRHTVDVVPFGVDTAVFRPTEAGRTRVGLSLGITKSLEHRYGIEYALRAMPRILSECPGATLTVAGDGRLAADLTALSRRLGVAEAVTFLGRVDHASVPDLMRTFDVLVNPTIVPESFGVAILEGSATGIPVVTTDVGGVREVCLRDETGCLVPARDPDAIASAVVSLAKDPERRARLGSTGRAFVEGRFEWERSVAAMLAVLESAIDDR